MTKRFECVGTAAIVIALMATGEVAARGGADTGVERRRPRQRGPYNVAEDTLGRSGSAGCLHKQGTRAGSRSSGRPNSRAKKLEEVEDSEFCGAPFGSGAKPRWARPRPSAGGETGAGSDPLVRETTGAKNSRAWLVVEPADGRIPPTTPDADKRAGPPVLR